MGNWYSEDEVRFNAWMEEQEEKDRESYPDDKELRFCWSCGSILRYNSMAYHEGFHFDGC